MQFLFPAFLFALLAIAVPIIIHLFYFRRYKKVYFTNVRFLKEVKEETDRRSRLKHWLVLLMRALAVVALVLAFAQPFIPKGQAVSGGQQVLGIYVDNSYSMSAQGQDAPLLEKAKQRAREIVRAHRPEDRFQILSGDLEGQHQRLVSQEDALGLIDELGISYAVQPLDKVLGIMEDVLNSAGEGSKSIYLISDFQKNITRFPAERDTSIRLNLVPVEAVRQRNISIDSAWFEAPVAMLQQANRLIVQVSNHSDEAAENVRMSLRQAGQQQPVGTLDIAPRATAYDTVNVTILNTGWQDATVSLTDYPVQFDDQYFFSFYVAEKIKVLAISPQQPNPYLRAALSDERYFEWSAQAAQAIDYADFAGKNLIVLDDLGELSSGLAAELRQYVEGGGNLLIFPARTANVAQYNNFLAQCQAPSLGAFLAQPNEASRLNTDAFVFSDVYDNPNAVLKLPSVQGYFALAGTGRGEERLIEARNGALLMLKQRFGKGQVFLSAAPLNTQDNGLARSAEVFVPMLYKMAIAAGEKQRLAYTIGRDQILEARQEAMGTGERVYRLGGTGGEFIPGQRSIGSRLSVDVGGQVREAGFYRLFLQADKPLAHYAFNYDRQESVPEYYASSELRQLAGGQADIIATFAGASLEALIGERSRGLALWKWCLVAALLFLLAESLLLRFWR